MKISTNLAISADGKISPSRGVAGAFTSDEDSQRFHELRRECDAILVGHGTLKADRMTMRVRDKPLDEQPLRCVISRRGNFDPTQPLFNSQGGPIHLVVTDNTTLSTFPSACQVHQVSLESFLAKLEQHLGIQHLHCEGGGELIHELARLDRIDDFYLTLSGQHLFGAAKSPTPTGDASAPYLPNSLRFKLVSTQLTHVGEILAHYQRQREI